MFIPFSARRISAASAAGRFTVVEPLIFSAADDDDDDDDPRVAAPAPEPSLQLARRMQAVRTTVVSSLMRGYSNIRLTIVETLLPARHPLLPVMSKVLDHSLTRRVVKQRVATRILHHLPRPVVHADARQPVRHPTGL